MEAIFVVGTAVEDQSCTGIPQSQGGELSVEIIFNVFEGGFIGIGYHLTADDKGRFYGTAFQHVIGDIYAGKHPGAGIGHIKMPGLRGLQPTFQPGTQAGLIGILFGMVLA